jgi:hypothetical protein
MTLTSKVNERTFEPLSFVFYLSNSSFTFSGLPLRFFKGAFTPFHLFYRPGNHYFFNCFIIFSGINCSQTGCVFFESGKSFQLLYSGLNSA